MWNVPCLPLSARTLFMNRIDLHAPFPAAPAIDR
jgi:hypothetical protein